MLNYLIQFYICFLFINNLYDVFIGTKKNEKRIVEKTEELIEEKTKKNEEFIAEKTKKTEELIEEKTKKNEELIGEKTKKTKELIAENMEITQELFNKAVNIQYKIQEIVHKIHKYYEWFFSIKTWNAKYSYSPHIPPFERELDADDLTNLQHTLIPHTYKFLLFESTLKIMEKHFGMYKRPIPNSNDKHYIFSINSDGLRKGTIEGCYESEVVKYAKFDPSRNYLDFNDYKITIDKLKENQRNYYESFLLSVKDIDETDEEFELRFLTHLLSICKETYSNYKLYMIAQGPKN
jgi:hypothetical protein